MLLRKGDDGFPLLPDGEHTAGQVGFQPDLLGRIAMEVEGRGCSRIGQGHMHGRAGRAQVNQFNALGGEGFSLVYDAAGGQCGQCEDDAHHRQQDGQHLVGMDGDLLLFHMKRIPPVC